MKFLAGLGTLLFVANGIWALYLNYRHSKAVTAQQGPRPYDELPETDRQRRIRKTVTWAFLVILAAVLIAFLIPLFGAIIALFV